MMPNEDVMCDQRKLTDSTAPEQGYNTLVSSLPGIIFWICKHRSCDSSLELEMLMEVRLKQDIAVHN
jgi:hypothetical protein